MRGATKTRYKIIHAPYSYTNWTNQQCLNITSKAGHYISVKDTMVFARMAGYMDCSVKNVTEIWLHPNNFNRDMGFTMSQPWNIAANILQCLQRTVEGRINNS
jgi:hypothetical protein